MGNVRCTYCGRYYKKIKDSDKCMECDKQYKVIFDSIEKRYAGALKGLAER